jgi:hypothetical protein
MPNPRFDNRELAAYGANCQREMMGRGLAGRRGKKEGFEGGQIHFAQRKLKKGRNRPDVVC